MDLFEVAKPTPALSEGPLASRLAPRDWDRFAGQLHLVSPDSLLRRAVEADKVGSCIFYGPPGTGKTALARLIARRSQAAIEYINATTAGVGDIRSVVKRASERRQTNGQKTILVIDEIHHFNRTQQDALLPDVERGRLTLIGLTTENPFFYVNAALMSRSTAFEFKPLTLDDLGKIWEGAFADAELGLGGTPAIVTPEAKDHILRSAGGDARRLLNILEFAVFSTPKLEKEVKLVDLEVAEASAQNRSVRYDKSGDDHYDVISAFIKSMRGSDPDAAIYWMAKMLSAGEDPRFIARRVVIFASEDVGNADPQALSVAVAAQQAVERIGMPEARIPLAQAVTYAACAAKSNAAYLALERALKEVEKGPLREVPAHLRDATMDRESRGHGKGYLYPHDFPGHHVDQVYMPDPVSFYQPTEQGREAELKKRLDDWRSKKPSNDQA